MQNQVTQIDLSHSIHIKNVHSAFTDELLYDYIQKQEVGQILKIKVVRDKVTSVSKGYAKVTFQNDEQVKHAIKKLNFTHILPSNIKDQKLILVTKNYKTDEFNEQKSSNNIYFTGLPEDQPFYNENGTETDWHPRKVYNNLTQYGEITSLKPAFNKTQSRYGGYGYITFQDEQSSKALLEKKVIKINNVDITFENYIPVNERPKSEVITQNFYIKDFFPELTADELENLDETIKNKTEQLRKLLNEKVGETTSVLVGKGKNDNENKLWAYANFKEEQSANKFADIITKNKQQDIGFLESTSINKQKQTQPGQAQTNILKKKLLIRNIAIPQLTAEEDAKSEEEKEQIKKEKLEQIKEEFISILKQYGDVISYYFKLNEIGFTTQNQSLKPAYSCQVEYATDEDAINLIMNYLNNKLFKQLFLENKFHGSVTIQIPKKDRENMVRTKKPQQNQQQIANAQLQQQFQAPVMTNNQAMFLSQLPYPNAMQNPQNFRRYQQFQYPQRQQYAQQYGNRGYSSQPNRQNNNYNQNQALHTQEKQNAHKSSPQPIAQNQNQQPNLQQSKQGAHKASNQPIPSAQANQQPAQANQQNAQQNISVQQLKANLDQFVKYPKQQQAQILGSLLFPQVSNYCQSQNYDQSLAPKITGMLIDFEVFEVADILNTLEDNVELIEKINEAYELINTQQQEQQ